MKRVIFLFLILFTGTLFSATHLMRFADVSQNHIVFTYENDLWVAGIDGSNVHRLTRGEGSELYAKFSPDGRTIAYSSNNDGGYNIYTIPVEGGVPTRLTWHPASDYMLEWYDDGTHLLFRSRREYPARIYQLYRISVNGGMPEKLPIDRAGLAAINSDGNQIAYNRTSREFRTWKRYKGGRAQNIWLTDVKKGTFEKIIASAGTDNFPMWEGDAIYFLSDRAHETLNLFKYDLQTKQISALTDYSDYDVKYPSIGNGKIIFQYKEQLHVLNLADGQVNAIPLEVKSDLTLVKEEKINPAKNTRSFSLSPDGERFLLETRGEIINYPVEEGKVYNITRASDSREKNAAWSPDGSKIAFLSDKSGEEEIYVTDVKGRTIWKQLTTNGSGYRMQLKWSPNSRYLIFADKALRLNMLDTKNNDFKTIDTGTYDDAWERWGIQDYEWSPDSRWIVYAKMEETMYESIFLYSLENNTITQVTENNTQDWSPFFSVDGKYLYFLSNRTFNPVMGFVDQNHVFLNMAKPYVLILKAGDVSPFRDKNLEEVKASDKKRTSVSITLNDFQRRIVAAPVDAGNYFRLEANEKGFFYLSKQENEFLKYQNVNDEYAQKNLDLFFFDLKKGETEKLISSVSNYHLSADGKKLVYKSGNSFRVVDAGKKAKPGSGKIDLSKANIRINKQQEFLQIYNEAWRVQRDWFYAPNMHGTDWNAVGEKYRKFVADCGTREDLNYLIGEMIGELNAGHTYIYGGDYPRGSRSQTGLLGIDLEKPERSNYFRIKHIIPGNGWQKTARSPFFEPGSPVKEGDYIIAIEGNEVTTSDNFYKYLAETAGKPIDISFNSKPRTSGAKSWQVIPIRSENTIRYNEWVTRNREYVDKISGGSIGYVHIPGMMASGLVEFARWFYPQSDKPGLILDVRHNGGGFVGDMILDRLERKLWAMSKPREGKPGRNPERAFYGHMVLLASQDSYSNAEYFTQAFKSKKMGKVIGQRTWGGAVGIENHQPLVDGAQTTPPQFGPYDLNKTWVIEGHGVEPDIPVVNLPADVLQGKDAQLETAISEVQKEIAEHPKLIPDHPDYPDKRKQK